MTKLTPIEYALYIESDGRITEEMQRLAGEYEKLTDKQLLRILQKRGLSEAGISYGSMGKLRVQRPSVIARIAWHEWKDSETKRMAKKAEKRAPNSSKQKAYLEPADVDALIEAAPTLRDRAIIRTLFYTAVRESELISIQVADIDYENHWITIQHLKARTHIKCECGAKLGRQNLFCSKCGKSVSGATIEKLQETRKRRVRVDAETLAMIQEYLKKRRDKKNPRLFPLSRQRIQQIVYEAAEDAGLGGKILQIKGLTQKHRISPHRLRDASLRFVSLEERMI